MHFSMAPIMREKSRKMAWLPESYPICAAIGGFPQITCMGWRQNWTKLKRIPCACILIMSAAYPWFLRKRIKPQEKLTKLMFLNVGKDENWNVCMGSHLNRGDHWTICHVDSIDLRGFYGMGAATSSKWDWWRLLESTHLWGGLPYTQWFAVIIPSTVPAWPWLWVSCATLYPLQLCGSVCGVVAVILAVIACFSIVPQGPPIYLSRPTDYSYLQHVFMAWIAMNETLPRIQRHIRDLCWTPALNLKVN